MRRRGQGSRGRAEAAADDWATADARTNDLRMALASAFAPKADLQGHLVDSSVEGFLTAMDII
jgi:enoyl-[acyl-carrier-protein] reductase (NADH)